jgi:hypothetical protein
MERGTYAYVVGSGNDERAYFCLGDHLHEDVVRIIASSSPPVDISSNGNKNTNSYRLNPTRRKFEFPSDKSPFTTNIITWEEWRNITSVKQ